MRHTFLKAASGLVLGFAVLTGCGDVAAPATVPTTITTTPPMTYPAPVAPATSTATPTSTTTSSAISVQPLAPVAPAPVAAPPKKAVPAECGSDYYRNVDGNCVHRPSGDPAGASAKCKDGTYSYSQNRRGTCSGHGGVATWL